HAAIDADLVALQALRIAGAVEAFVVLRNALFDRLREAHRLAERLEAEPDVLLEDVVLGWRQHAGLLEQRLRQPRLADVGQHADRAQVRELASRQAQVSAQRNQVKRDPQAVRARI